jgi:CRP-like cAMP-binding protein
VLALHPQGWRLLAQQVCQLLRRTFNELESTLDMPLDARMAIRLLALARQTGSPALRLSHEELGRMMSRTRQTVAKQLQAWEAQGRVRCDYRTIEIDVAALEAVAAGAVK